MDVITFEIGNITIQLANGEALFWRDGTDHEPDITLDLLLLSKALSTAHMLSRSSSTK